MEEGREGRPFLNPLAYARLLSSSSSRIDRAFQRASFLSGWGRHQLTALRRDSEFCEVGIAKNFDYCIAVGLSLLALFIFRLAPLSAPFFCRRESRGKKEIGENRGRRKKKGEVKNGRKNKKMASLVLSILQPLPLLPPTQPSVLEKRRGGSHLHIAPSSPSSFLFCVCVCTSPFPHPPAAKEKGGGG